MGIAGRSGQVQKQLNVRLLFHVAVAVVVMRQTLGSLAVKLGRFTDAARHLQRLRHAEVDRAELEQTLAWCYLGSGDTEQAAQCFASAIQLAPQRVINYVQLAELWLRQD